MAAPINPASTKAFGKEKWIFVPTIAAPSTTGPTVAELTGGSTLDVSCYLFDDTDRPTQNTNLVSKQRRVCDTAVYQQVGVTTYTGGQMMYALNPQAAAASDGKKAWEKFPAGTVGYMVRRLGIAYDTDIAAGQFVDIYPCEVGPGMPTTAGDGEAAEVASVHTWAVTSAPTFVKAVAA